MANKYHAMNGPEKPGVRHRRMQAEHAEAELAETKRMMRSDPTARTGIIEKRQVATRAQAAYQRIRKATGY